MVNRFIFIVFGVVWLCSSLFAAKTIYTLGHIKDQLKVKMINQLNKQFDYVIPESVSVVIQNEQALHKMPKACCDFSFQIDQKARVLGRTIVPMQFYDCDGQLMDEREIAIKVTAKATYLKSMRHLRSGEYLSSENVRVTVLPMYGKPYNALRNISDLKGSTALNFVSEGTILTSFMVRPKPIIDKDQMVDVVYGNGDVELKFRGKVLEDGIQDQIVRVEMKLGEKKVLEGKVLDEKTVFISR